MRKIFAAFILALTLLAPLSVGASLDFNNEIKNIYNVYSQYLDTKWVALGWEYNVPSRHYREIGLNSIDDIRMQATLATTYRFRADAEAKYKIKTALTNILGSEARIVKSVPNGQGIYVSTRGFGDVIGLYLALKLTKDRGDIFTKTEQAQIFKRIKEVYPYALAGYDNENRALLAAAYGLPILRAADLNFTEAEKNNYKKQIENKIKIGLRSIDSQGVYREGKDKKYSTHYQLVSALMLANLGKTLPNKAYSAKARAMLQYAHQQYPLGKLDWRGSARPTGIGLQTVLLRALGEQYLNNKNWLQYWETESANRGFIDQANPGRLAWRDEVDKTLNDDYSFMNMVELLVAELN